MTLPKEIWAEDKTMAGDQTPNGYWEGRKLPRSKKYVRADTDLALAVISAGCEAQAAYERQQELEAENSRLRGIIAEMTFYDWTASPGSPNSPPGFFREEVARAIGFQDAQKENGND